MTTECIVFANLSTSGYSRIELPGNRRELRHRHVWEKRHGRIPKGMKVLHKCDNRACSNIEHLFLGTQRDNMEDMARKGRGNGLLSPERVIEIRALVAAGETQRSVSRRLGVHENVVSRIMRGLRYSWVK